MSNFLRESLALNGKTMIFNDRDMYGLYDGGHELNYENGRLVAQGPIPWYVWSNGAEHRTKEEILDYLEKVSGKEDRSVYFSQGLRW